MDLSLQSLILIPIGLGLLGFIEPCTIGGHLLFLDTQNERHRREKISAVITFVLVRAIVMGLFGGVIAYVGQKLIGVQTRFWLVFGGIYLIVGLAFIFGKAGFIKQKIDLSPAVWKQTQSPVVLGLAFGLNIPACAAPILFGLLSLAATTGTLVSGFIMMGLFGLSLSLPLAVFAAFPSWAAWLARLGKKLKSIRWLIGAIFIVLGIWSIYFGLYVDPANWAGTK